MPAMLERLGSRDVRTRIRADIARDGLNNFGRIPSWDAVRVAMSPHLPGIRRAHLRRPRARARPRSPRCRRATTSSRTEGETRILVTSMADADVHEIARTPWITLGSDGNSLATSGVTGQGKPHPRYYGTFARRSGHCVRDLRLFTLPAGGLEDDRRVGGGPRPGRPRPASPGFCADVAVFDPARIAERATYEDPHQYAAGVSTVLVNGEVVIDGGDHTGALPGRVMRRGV